MSDKKKCPSCGSLEMKRNGSINHVSGMGYVSNSYEKCDECGHFEAFGPRW